MADVSTEIELKVDWDKRGLRSATRDIKNFDRYVNGISSKNKASKAMTTMIDGYSVKWKKQFDFFDKMIKGMGKMTLKMLSLSMKGVLLEMGLMSAAMLAIHGSFVLGNAAMKAARSLMGPLAAGMTAITAAAAAASAAIREQQAAMWAYKTTAKGEFGSSLNQTRQVMRGLHTDSYLAAAGVENLNKAFGTISSTSNFTQGSQNLLRGLMDFAAAGQPLDQGVQKAAELIAIMQNSKKTFYEAKTAAEGLFPDKEAVKKAMRELGINTKQELRKAILSGEFSKAAGLEGQYQTVSDTLINRFKTYFTVIRNQFADLGQPFLKPLKDGTDQIFKILQRSIIRISGTTEQFALTKMIDGLVSATEKLSNKVVEFMNTHTGSVDGMFQKMSDWWKRFTYGWERIKDALRPYIEGARVIESAFGAAWQHIKAMGSSKFMSFNTWLQDNRETVKETGASIGELIASVMKFIGAMGDLTRDLLPFINKVISGLSTMVNYMTSFVQGLRSIGGNSALGALAVLAGSRMMGSKMANTKGALVASRNYNNVNISAGTVNVGGPGTGGGAPKVVPGGGGLGTSGLLFGGAGSPGSLSSRGGLASRTGGYIAPSMMSMMGGAVPSGPSSPIGGPGFIGPQKWLNEAGYRVKKLPPLPGKWGMLSKGFNKSNQWYYDNFIAENTETDVQRQSRLASRKGLRGAFSKRTNMMRKARSQSRFGKGLGKFQGSGGARFGTMMGMGMLGSMMPAEAQGAMALGASVSAINPLLGLGIGFGGTALKAKTATGGALSGALGGAAMGGMVASIIPGVGPAAGVVVGAIIGAVGGAVMGRLNKAKAEAKAARKAAENTTQSIIDIALSGVFRTVAGETGVGRSATRGALGITLGRLKTLKGAISGVPGETGGARGGQMGLAFEHYTGKRMPSILGGLMKAVMSPADMVGNALYGTISKLGGVSLLDNRILNPFGYGTSNYKDVDKKKQQAAITNLYRNRRSYGISLDETGYKDAMKDPGKYIDKLNQQVNDEIKAQGVIQENYIDRLDQLNKITGKSDREINDLAKTMGVNLFDSTKDFKTVLDELGLTAVKTAQQFKDSLTKGLLQSLSAFDEGIKALEAPEILNETARSFGDLIKSVGGEKVQKKDKLKFLKDMQEQMIAYYNDPGTAFAQFLKSFDVGGTAYRQKGGNLYGQESALALASMPEFQKYKTQGQAALAKSSADQLNAVLLSSGLSIDANKLRTRVESMTPEQLNQLSQLAEGGFKSIRNPSAATAKLLQEGGMEAVLKSMGLGGLGLTTIKDTKIELSKFTEGVADATTKMIEQMKAFYADTANAVPKWYNEYPVWWKENDTSTPRGSRIGDTTSSRLSMTMARHASMNSMLTGKRSVTSSYRNYGLGSINSDHVTGRAYDLVGQNLGAYQSLVKVGGGFAEFHGVGGARHLHVVPGPGIGDSATPVAPNQSFAPYATQPTGGFSNTYQFYITGTPNASADEIAEKVMVRIKETERSNRERF